MLLFSEKHFVFGEFDHFCVFKFFFCEMYSFAKLKLKYTLFQENHAFPLQNSDLKQKVESDNAFVL